MANGVGQFRLQIMRQSGSNSAANQQEEVISKLDTAAEFILKVGLKGKSYWLNKANIFSLIIAVVQAQTEGFSLMPTRVKQALDSFKDELPQEYKLAAAEFVNSTRARQLRHKYLFDVLVGSLQL